MAEGITLVLLMGLLMYDGGTNTDGINRYTLRDQVALRVLSVTHFVSRVHVC